MKLPQGNAHPGKIESSYKADLSERYKKIVSLQNRPLWEPRRNMHKNSIKQFCKTNPTRLSLTGVLLVTAVFAAHILVPRIYSTLPDDTHLTLLADATLAAPDMAEAMPLMAGEKVRLLGVVPSRNGQGTGALWIETADGMLGYADPAAFDTVGVVRHLTRRSSLHTGDSVALLSSSINPSGWRQYEVRRRDGTTGTLNATDIAYPTADRFVGSHSTLTGQPRRLMSTQTFERRYLRHTYRQNRSHDMPPQFAIVNDSGFTTLENIYLLGQDGRWYRPRLCYNRDSLAIGYKVSHGFVRNRDLSSLLYPAQQTMLRSPLTAWQGSRPVYHVVSADGHRGLGRLSAQMRRGLLWVIFFVPWLYLTPLLPSWLLFFLLRYPSLLWHLGNRTMRRLLSALAILSALLWLVVILPAVPAVLYLAEIPILGIYIYFLHHGLLNDRIPHARCPHCHRLYTLRPAGKHLVEETERWNSLYPTAGSDAAPATLADPYADDDVLYRVREYNRRFRCRQCGHTEELVTHETEEIKRVKKASRTESYHIHRPDDRSGQA